MVILVAVFFLLAMLALLALGFYDLFFSKGKSNELTNLEKRYVDPELAKAQIEAVKAEQKVKAEVQKVVAKF